ncbi:hypothetical protein ACLOJK_031516 [Asimina triloba]
MLVMRVNDPLGLVGSLRKILPEQRTQASLPSSTTSGSLANGYIVSHEWIMPTSHATDCYNRTPPLIEKKGEDEKKGALFHERAHFPRKILRLLSLLSPNLVDLFRSSSSGVVCGKDIPQREERSPPHNAVDARPLHVVGAPPREDRVLSNSPDPSGESLNSPVMWAKFHTLMEMIKSLQQQMVHVRPNTTSVPLDASAGIPSPMTAATLTSDMAPIAHHHQATSQPHPSPTLRMTDLNNPLALHLQVQPIPDGFSIPEMAIFGPTLDPTGHVVNYNIHMNIRTTSEWLKRRAFVATLDEQRKMWFASLAPGSIISFGQLTDLFEAQFSNQQ